MLSIIISSHNISYFNALTENIEKTCGVKNEIIKIDNPGAMGICKAYNLGASKASFCNLLFLHEDVKFKEKNWGKIIIDHLADSSTGIIGVAGSAYVPVAPSGWYITKQHSHKVGKTKILAVDGVFLAITNKHFTEFLFNEAVEGFHGYDLDISLRVAKKYSNYIVDDIKIEHFSSGNPNKQWLDNNIQIRRNIGSKFQEKNNPFLEKQAYINFLKSYFSYNRITLKNILKTLEFYPYTKITFMDHFEIFKQYFYFYRFRKMFHKRYKSF